MSIFLLFIINQEIDFEDLFNRATTSLVQFQIVKDSAFEKLIEMGQDSLFADTTIDFLVSKFDTKSARERHTLKDILKKIGSPAIKGIVKKLDYRGKDRTSRSLAQSLWVLGEIGSEEIVEPVALFIDDEQWQIRSGAYTALGKPKSIQALPYILKGLNDSIPIVRKSAYYALSQIATADEIDYLIDGLDDEFYGVRFAAVEGLVNIGEMVFEPLMDIITKEPQKEYFVFKALSQLDINVQAKAQIHKCLSEKETQIRFLIYEGCENKNLLKTFIELEDNKLLRNYIIEKISEIQ